MPTPKWKLVVDVGGAAPPKEDSSGHPTDARVEALLNLIVENTVSLRLHYVHLHDKSLPNNRNLYHCVPFRSQLTGLRRTHLT